MKVQSQSPKSKIRPSICVSQILSHLRISPLAKPSPTMEADTVSLADSSPDPEQASSLPLASSPPNPAALPPVPPVPTKSHESQPKPNHPPIRPPTPATGTRSLPNSSPQVPRRRRNVISRVRVLGSGSIVSLPVGRRAHARSLGIQRGQRPTRLCDIRFPHGPPVTPNFPLEPLVPPPPLTVINTAQPPPPLPRGMSHLAN